MTAATASRRDACVGLGFAGVLAALVAALLVATHFGTAVMSFGGYLATADATLAAPFGAVAAVVVVGGVLLAARSPELATAVVLAPFLIVPWSHAFVWGWYAALVAVTLVAVARGWRHAVLPWAVTIGVTVMYCGTEVVAYLPIGPVTSGTGDEFEWVVLALYALWVTGLTAVTGAVVARRDAVDAAQRAQGQEDRALVTDALARERARMARDLHDVVAHHVSLIAVRAESAPYQYPDLDEDARAVLADVAQDARAALGELREALAILRRTDDEPDETGAPTRRPQPTAADITELLDDARGAGQDVRATGAWQHVPDAVGYVLYRATQEALTNARRHAPGATVDVERVQGDGHVGLRVRNPRPGPGRPVRRGRGLVGMQERVDAVGGTLHADARGDEFVLELDLPVGAGA